MKSREEMVRISKKLAGLLRHYGRSYGVEVDEEGWASIVDVVRALRRMGFNVTVEDIIDIVRTDEKGRYEIRGGRIRARYGHSIKVRIKYERVSPEIPLYHGTPVRNLPSIREKGLLPGKRLYVHLASDPKQAVETGKRYSPTIALLRIDPQCIKRHGITIYKATEKVYLAPYVPPDCIEVDRIL